MDQQPVAYIYYDFVRILAYHNNGYTCVNFKNRTIKFRGTDTNRDHIMITDKLEDGVERFKWEGATYYVKDCYYHREDGPAIIRSKSEENNEYWLRGNRYENVEDYFEALTAEQKTKAIFNMDEMRKG